MHDRFSQPIIFRRSYRLRPTTVLLLEIGMWLIIGVYSLYAGVDHLGTANKAGMFLVAGLLIIPALFSQLELRSWLGHHATSYSLIKPLERRWVRFIAAWTYLLGWGALSALLATAFGEYANKLLITINPLWNIAPVYLAAGMTALFIIVNMLGYRASWLLSTRIAGSAIAVLLVLAALLLAGMPIIPGQVPASTAVPFFTVVAAMMAMGWVGELMAEVRGRRRTVRSVLNSAFAGPGLAILLTLAAFSAASSVGPLDSVPVLITYGTPVMAGFGVLVTMGAWQVLALLMLRQFRFLGEDGLFSDTVIRRYGRFKSPVILILIQGLLAGGGLLLGSSLIMAHLAALAYLILQIIVALASILLARHPRAENRSLKLPFFPIIPLSAIAINLLLIAVMPLWPVILGALIWYGVGILYYWQIVRSRIRSAELGVTLFQDAEHGNIDSPYPVLVPIANPDTATGLVAFGAEIARRQGGHLTILQVVVVPEQFPLDSARFQGQQTMDLMKRVIQEAEAMGVQVEAITRLARSISQGIIDTMTEETSKMVIMGWQARTREPGRRGLGNILDDVIDSATCDIAIVRGDWSHDINRILVPVSTGPHAPRAAELGLSLTADRGGKVTLLNVARPDETKASYKAGRALLDELVLELSAPQRTVMQVTEAESPLDGIIAALQDHDALLLGVSEISFLDQPAMPDMPLHIAQETDKPFALIRNYSGLTNLVARKAWQSLSDVLPTLNAQEQMAVYRDMQRAARPNINYFVLITLSALIATFGLLANSPAVIIGAMLVAPLMTPFVAAAVGIVFGDAKVLQNAVTSIIQGVVVAIFISIIAALISPLSDVTPEVLARTQPTLLDLLVGLVSGMAGAYAIARKEVGAALPGVAIAAALMPPICSAGIGIALGNVAIASGAFFLFITNLVAIIFASAVVFLLLGMRPPQSADRQRRLRQGLLISIISIAVISVPLALILFQTVERGRIETQSHAIIESTIDEWGDVDLVDFNVEYGWQDVRITGTLHAAGSIDSADMSQLEERLNAALRPHVEVDLFAIQGVRLQEPPD